MVVKSLREMHLTISGLCFGEFTVHW